MSSNILPKSNAFRLKTLGAAIASAMLFNVAHAAGLGELSVLSSLGQPLRADVELILNAKDDDAPLRVKLASPDAYRQANIEFNAALTSLRFSVEQRGGRYVVHVSSAQPINEPFLDLLLEVGSGSGRVVREYALLLDPPSLYPAPQVPPAQAAAATARGSNASPAQQTAKREPRSEPKRASEAPAVRPAAGRSRLTLSSAGTVGSGKSAVSVEEYAAMEKAVNDANVRVQSLEQKVGDLQKLLEVTNSLLIEMQRQSELAKANAKPAAAAGTATAPAASASASVAPAASAPAPAVAAPKPRKPLPPPEPDTSLDLGILLAPGIGLLAVLVGGFGIFRMRRKRAQQAFDATLFTDAGKAANADAQQAGVPRTDAGNAAVALAQPAATQQTGLTDIDVLSEADVYIAFGRDVQAEQVLKDALHHRPQLHAARVKLLTIYAARKDTAAFELLATELYSMTRGEGEEWTQAATMGRDIDPGNPLYTAAGRASANITALAAAPVVAETHAPRDDATTELGNFAEPAAIDLIPLPQVPEADDVLQVEPLPEEPKQMESAASNVLDFALPSLEEEAMDVPAIPVEPVVVQQPDPEPVALDFELPDLDLPAVPAASEQTAPVASAEPQPGTGPIDFEFLLPEIPMPAAKPVEEAVAATDDVGLMDLEFLEPETEQKVAR